MHTLARTHTFKHVPVVGAGEGVPVAEAVECVPGVCVRARRSEPDDGSSIIIIISEKI